MRRRQFLRSSAALPALAAPLAPGRIRGRVTSARDGRGLRGVVVSDGVSSVATGSAGDFTLASDTRQRFAFVSTPRGFELPERFYAPLRFDARGETSVSFTLTVAADDGERHRFLAFGDTQIANPAHARLLHEATTRIAEQTAGETFAFGVTLGDLVDDALELFPEYDEAVKRTGVPFFQVLGNHDLDAARGSFRGTLAYEEHFGPIYYSFNRGAVHYVVLNDVFWIGNGYIGFISEHQLDWLASDLAHVERGAPVVVFAHVPFSSTVSERIGGKIAPNEAQVTNRDRLLDLLEPFDARLMSAHTHENEHVFHGDVHEHVLGTVCGAWWTGPICWDGTPNGFHVFEVQGHEFSWQLRGTGLPAEKQFRAYVSTATDGETKSVFANVWNWDPGWRVSWIQDGERRGEMSRGRGLDPVAVELYRGEDKPSERGDWVEPILTDHIFHARPTAAARRVTIEATDPFGRTYVEAVEL